MQISPIKSVNFKSIKYRQNTKNKNIFLRNNAYDSVSFSGCKGLGKGNPRLGANFYKQDTLVAAESSENNKCREKNILFVTSAKTKFYIDKANQYSDEGICLLNEVKNDYEMNPSNYDVLNTEEKDDTFYAIKTQTNQLQSVNTLLHFNEDGKITGIKVDTHDNLGGKPFLSSSKIFEYDDSYENGVKKAIITQTNTGGKTSRLSLYLSDNNISAEKRYGNNGEETEKALIEFNSGGSFIRSKFEIKNSETGYERNLSKTLVAPDYFSVMEDFGKDSKPFGKAFRYQ